jgi:hypothetical protein
MDNVLRIAACTLPTGSRPLRLREFDTFFGAAVRSVERTEPGRVRLDLVATPEIAATAASLLVRETACCSFFTFELLATAGQLTLDVCVPEQYRSVLEAVSQRAEELVA